MFPRLISVGSFDLPTYGVLVVSGLIAGLFFASRLGEREGMKRDDVYNLGIYLALAGILGSKLALILQESAYYYRNPGQLFSMSTLQSGGVFYGGLILAILVGFWYTRRHHLPFLKTSDAFAPGIAIGHAIGRLGCFSAGCCWGLPTSLPWGVTFTDQYSHDAVGVPLGVALHPTQLYESAAELLIFIFLYSQYRKKQFDGQMLGWYLVLYSTARLLVEFLRHHDPEAMIFGSLSDAQGISLVLIGIGAWLLWLRPHRREQPSLARL
ncbi:MAG TPA: prolipoprotein diacylglyceryl transferase [Candidatus Glassbacteria bacterium]|nr:prolipoprotein diacylglyceryl transferase [Candidatus Glassbacteria bacterium]